MLKSISEIERIAGESVSEDDELKICGNCNYFNQFKKETIEQLSKLLNHDFKKDDGICKYYSYTGILEDLPFIVNKYTTHKTISEIYDDDCFEWDKEAYNLEVSSRYNSIEMDYWDYTD